MLHYFQREAGKVMLQSIIKGGPGLFKTGKVSPHSIEYNCSEHGAGSVGGSALLLDVEFCLFLERGV